MQACRLGDEQTCCGPVCDRVLALTETISNGLITVVSAAVAEGAGAGAPLPPGLGGQLLSLSFISMEE